MKLKRLISKIMVAAMIISLLQGISITTGAATPTDYWTAPGNYTAVSEGNITISTAAQLAGLAVLVNSGVSFSGYTVNLDSDLDLSAHLWTPIGTSQDSTICFAGKFNGNNHTITGLTIDYSGNNQTAVGLFGYLHSTINDGVGNAAITNLNLTGASITTSTASNSNIFVGVLVGDTYYSPISNCYTQGSITIGTNNVCKVGGLVGQLSGNYYSPVTSCHSNVTVTTISNSTTFGCVGGLIGMAMDKEIRGCYAEGSVSSACGKTWAGGLVGVINNMTIDNCYATGNVSGTYRCAGGLIGSVTNSVNNHPVNNCYSTGNVTRNSADDGYAGGLCGETDINATNSYSSGMVSGAAYNGGYAGKSTAAAVASSTIYFDGTKNSTGIGTGSGATANAMTTADMRNSYFSGILGCGTWMYSSNLNNGYPMLRGVGIGAVPACIITYSSDNSTYASIAVAQNSVFSAPPEPTKSSSTFVAWYTDSSCTSGNEWDFTTGTVSSDTTLFAGWMATTYFINGTVTYSGLPCSGTSVSLYTGYGTGSQTLVKSVNTDCDGAYELSNLTGGTYTLVVAASTGYYEETAQNITVSENLTGQNIALKKLITNPDYYITNAGGDTFNVNGSGSYSSLSTALTNCSASGSDGALIINFGGMAEPLTLYKSTSSLNNNNLITATYKGTVEIADSALNSVGLIIPDGVTATFDGLTVSDKAGSTAYNAVYLAGSGSLSVLTGTLITAEVPASCGIFANGSGTVTMTGGTVAASGTAIVNNSSGRITLSGGAVNSTGSALSNNSTGLAEITGSASLTTKSTVSINSPAGASDNSGRITLFGTTYFSSSKANLNFTGVADGSDYTITSGNYSDVLLRTANIAADYLFISWTSDAARQSNLSTSDGIALSTLSNASNTVYANIVKDPATLHVPASGTFTDTDGNPGKIGGTISWASPDSTEGLTGYKVFWSEDGSSVLSSASSAVYTVANAGTVSQTVAANTTPPSGASYFLIYSYNGLGNSSACRSISFTDVDSTVTVGGTVTPSIPGYSVDGLTVKLYAPGDTSYSTPLYSGTTDLNGTYSIANTLPGSYVSVISADAGGNYATSISSVFTITTNAISNANITLSVCTYTISGTVIPNKPGFSVDGLTVNLYASSDTAYSNVLKIATANTSGAYSIDDVINGSYIVVIADDPNGNYEQSVSSGILVNASNSAACNITLNVNTFNICGTVAPSIAGYPVNGLTVKLYDSSDMTHTTMLYSAVTDSDGKYSIADVVARTYIAVIEADANGGHTQSASSSFTVSGADATSVDVTISVSSFSVSGTISAGTTGASKEGITLNLYASSDSNYTTSLGSGATDATGAYTINPKVINGSYVLVITAAANGKYEIATHNADVSGNDITTADIILVNNAPTVKNKTDSVIAGNTYSLSLDNMFADSVNDTMSYEVNSCTGSGICSSKKGILTYSATSTDINSGAVITITATDSASNTAQGTITLQVSAAPTSSGGTVTTIVSAPTGTISTSSSSSNGMTTTTTTVSISGTTSGGIQTVPVPENIMTTLTDAAKKSEAAGGTAISSINAGSGTGLTNASVSIPGKQFDDFASGTNAALQIASGIATVTFSGDAVDAIASADSGDVSFGFGTVDTSTLNEAQQAAVGSRPVHSFSVTVGGTAVSQFIGTVTVSLPYTLDANEDPNAIVVYYIDASGNLKLMNGAYDEATGTVSFETAHFSDYVIGYNKVSYTDVANSAWYGDAVTFLAARNITSGTSSTTFSPGATLTRGQFVKLLLRAYGIEADMNPAGNFSDAGNTYYTGYLAAAKKLGISNGIGNNRFAPDQAITRQEMFKLLYNALKVLDKLPKGESGKALSDFTDAGNVASWASEAMTALVKTGTVSGSSGKLLPENTTTRAEMAQVLYNLLVK